MIITDLLSSNFKIYIVYISDFNKIDENIEFLINNVNLNLNILGFSHVYFMFDNYQCFQITNLVSNRDFLKTIIKNTNSYYYPLIFSNIESEKVIYRKTNNVTEGLGFEKMWLLPLIIKSKELMYYSNTDEYVITNNNIKPQVFLLEGKLLQTVTEKVNQNQIIYNSPFIPSIYVNNDLTDTRLKITKFFNDLVPYLSGANDVILMYTNKCFRFLLLFSRAVSQVTISINLADAGLINPIATVYDLEPGFNLIDFGKTIATRSVENFDPPAPYSRNYLLTLINENTYYYDFDMNGNARRVACFIASSNNNISLGYHPTLNSTINLTTLPFSRGSFHNFFGTVFSNTTSSMVNNKSIFDGYYIKCEGLVYYPMDIFHSSFRQPGVIKVIYDDPQTSVTAQYDSGVYNYFFMELMKENALLLFLDNHYFPQFYDSNPQEWSTNWNRFSSFNLIQDNVFISFGTKFTSNLVGLVFETGITRSHVQYYITEYGNDLFSSSVLKFEVDSFKDVNLVSVTPTEFDNLQGAITSAFASIFNPFTGYRVAYFFNSTDSYNTIFNTTSTINMGSMPNMPQLPTYFRLDTELKVLKEANRQTYESFWITSIQILFHQIMQPLNMYKCYRCQQSSFWELDFNIENLPITNAAPKCQYCQLVYRKPLIDVTQPITLKIINVLSSITKFFTDGLDKLMQLSRLAKIKIAAYDPWFDVKKIITIPMNSSEVFFYPSDYFPEEYPYLFCVGISFDYEISPVDGILVDPSDPNNVIRVQFGDPFKYSDFTYSKYTTIASNCSLHFPCNNARYFKGITNIAQGQITNANIMRTLEKNFTVRRYSLINRPYDYFHFYYNSSSIYQKSIIFNLEAQDNNEVFESTTGFQWRTIMEHLIIEVKINNEIVGETRLNNLFDMERFRPSYPKCFVNVSFNLLFYHNPNIANFFGLTATTDYTVANILFRRIRLYEVNDSYIATTINLPSTLYNNILLETSDYIKPNLGLLSWNLPVKDMYSLSTDTKWDNTEFSWYHTTNLQSYYHGAFVPFSEFDGILLSLTELASRGPIYSRFLSIPIPALLDNADFIVRAVSIDNPSFIYSTLLNSTTNQLVFPLTDPCRFSLVISRKYNASYDTNLQFMILLGEFISSNNNLFDIPIEYTVQDGFSSIPSLTIQDPNHSLTWVIGAQEALVGNTTVEGATKGERIRESHWTITPIGYGDSTDFKSYVFNNFIYSSVNQEWDKVYMINESVVNIICSYKYLTEVIPSTEVETYAEQPLVECIYTQDFDYKYHIEAIYPVEISIFLKNIQAFPVNFMGITNGYYFNVSIPEWLTHYNYYYVDINFKSLLRHKVLVFTNSTTSNNQYSCAYINTPTNYTYFIQTNLKNLSQIYFYSQRNFEFEPIEFILHLTNA